MAPENIKRVKKTGENMSQSAVQQENIAVKYRFFKARAKLQ